MAEVENPVKEVIDRLAGLPAAHCRLPLGGGIILKIIRTPSRRRRDRYNPLTNGPFAPTRTTCIFAAAVKGAFYMLLNTKLPISFLTFTFERAFGQ
jgi:hypothetical protein